jgi:hypothetical protein
MKAILKRIYRDERGVALILALVVLLVGGLITAGLLSHMGAGLLAQDTYNRRTAELYAADAGVEDAVWRIQSGETLVCPGYRYWSYNMTDVNGKTVEVSVEYLDGGTYKITSIAASTDGGNIAALVSATTIESYVSASYMDFSSLLDNAIVSYDTIQIQPGNTVDGDVWLPDKDNLDIHDPAGITGEVRDAQNDGVELSWPTVEQLSAYYLDDLGEAPDPGSSVNVQYTDTIGPSDRQGSLAIDNTGDPATLVLEGTVYIRGDAEFLQAGSHDYTLDLNGHTVFAEGAIAFPSNVVGVSGPGCIIAVGDVNFQPSIVGDDFVLVMSIAGQVYFHPSGDFTGCIAGNADVQLQPNCAIDWISPEGKGLDFPMGTGDDDESPPMAAVQIESYEITQQ